MRKRLGIQPGDLVALVETAEGVLITPRSISVAEALDRAHAALPEQGYTIDDLDDFIEEARAGRDALTAELYGTRLIERNGVSPISAWS